MLAEAFRRIRRGQLDWTLSGLQALTLLSTGAFAVCLVLLYRHQTEDYFIDAWAYLGSIRIVVPPLLVLAASYAYAVLTGNSVTEAPKAFLSWLRNQLLQRRDWLIALNVVVLMICAGILVFTTRSAPPHYESFVARLLGGESDDHQVIAAEIKRMEDRNPPYAEKMSLVMEVFTERRKWNFENRAPTTTMPRYFIRALTTNIDDPQWESHPLRMHAAAEAASMYTQALFSTDPQAAADPKLWRDRRDEAIGLYRIVSESSDPRATLLLKRSALNNIGNLHFYLGEYAEAVDVYTALVAAHPNTSTYGNLVASLISLGRPEEARQEGELGKEWALANRKMLAEPVQFANMLANLGFAYWMVNQPEKALAEVEAAYDLNPDPGSTQNLVVARWLAGDAHRALDIAKTLPEVAVTLDSQAEVAARSGRGACTYLLRALAASTLGTPEGQQDAVLNLYTFLGEPRLARDFSGATDTQLAALLGRAYASLPGLKSPCSSLSLVPGIQHAMRGLGQDTTERN